VATDPARTTNIAVAILRQAQIPTRHKKILAQQTA